MFFVDPVITQVSARTHLKLFVVAMSGTPQLI